jgi:hypothetical protein
MAEDYVLVKYGDNWADEFDVNSTWVVRKPVWEEWKTRVVTKITNEVEIYFGTNEYITVDSGEAVVKKCKVQEIPESDAKVIAKYFGKSWDKLEEGGILIGQISVFDRLADQAS